MDKSKDENKSFVWLGLSIIFLIAGLWLITATIIYIDTSTKENICKSLDLGNYDAPKTVENSKIIDNVQYFKCTKEIYNSTTKEIITVEKWVKLP